MDFRHVIRDFYELHPHGGRMSVDELRERTAAIRGVLGQRSAGHLLDLGCGIGVLSPILEGASKNYYGVDVSRAALDLARQRIRGGVLAASAEAVPIRDGVVEIVVCSEVIEHIPDVSLALAEIGRVLVPNGRLILTTPNLWSPRVFLRWVYCSLTGKSQTDQIYDRPVSQKHLLHSMRRADLVCVSIRSYFYQKKRSPRGVIKAVFEIGWMLMLRGLRRPTGLYLMIEAVRLERV